MPTRSKSPQSVWIWIKPDASHSKVFAEALAKEFQAHSWSASIGGEPQGNETVALSIGGDGTFLSMIRRLGSLRFSAKLVGIHGSRGIGFLTSLGIPAEKEALPWAREVVGKIIAGEGSVSERFGLSGKIKNKELWATNDVTVGKHTLSRLVGLQVSTNEGVVYKKLKGDGIILSSALGSTAYSMSAGGPVVDPRMKLLVMTPICPHPLPQRPLVLPPEITTKVKVLEPSMVTLDGQESQDLQEGDELTIEVCAKPLKFYNLGDGMGTYFDRLSQKLGVGG